MLMDSLKRSMVGMGLTENDVMNMESLLKIEDPYGVKKNHCKVEDSIIYYYDYYYYYYYCY